MIVRYLSTISLVALLALLLAACGGAPATQPTQATAEPTTAPAVAAPTAQPTAAPAPTEAPIATATPLKVVATYSILGDLVQNVVGDSGLIELTVLVGPSGDAHTYEPTPRDSEALAEADILFENGLEFESWIDDLYAASGSTATRVAVAEEISDLIPSTGHNHDHEEPLAHACEHFEDSPETVTADAIDAVPTVTIPDDHTHYAVSLADGAGTVGLSRAEDAEVRIGASIGIALNAADLNESMQSLLERADQAMYVAKHGGKGHLIIAEASAASERHGRQENPTIELTGESAP